MSPLEAGERALIETIRRHGSRICLVTENGNRVHLKANIGETRPLQQGAGSAALPQTIVITRDFLVPTADLITHEITRSCRIEFAGKIFQPAPAGRGEPMCHDSGRFGLVKRIRTVMVN